MSFSDKDKAKALAIIKIFETGKPLGDYSAVAVLKDGAGISYGMSQFTHKSKSLGAVVERYIKLGGKVPPVVVENYADIVAGRNIPKVAGNNALKAALRELGKTSLMQRAQREIASEKYLTPALEAAAGSDFVYPLSLAVIYDSKIHGSYPLIRDRVKVKMPGNGSMKPEEFEKEWITQYVNKRYAWLAGHKNKLLRTTVYRMNFFLGEIRRGNWQLNLPVTVHGRKLTNEILFPQVSAAAPAVETTPSEDFHQSALAASTSLSPSVADSTEQPSSSEVTVKEEIETPGGTSSVTVTEKNEQSVDETVKQPGPEPYQKIGFWKVIKRDLAAATGGNLTFEGLSQYAQQASGWPEWVIALIGKLTVLALIGTAGYFLFRVVHFFVDRWQKNERNKLLAEINTDKNRKDIEFTEPVQGATK